MLFLKSQNKSNKIDDFINTFLDIFSDNFYFELQRINDIQLDEYENNLVELSNKFKIPLISSNNVKFEKSQWTIMHMTLFCVFPKKLLVNQSNRIFSNSETYFKSSDQMNKLILRHT